jgi:hypothetical protein
MYPWAAAWPDILRVVASVYTGRVSDWKREHGRCPHLHSAEAFVAEQGVR